MKVNTLPPAVTRRQRVTHRIPRSSCKGSWSHKGLRGARRHQNAALYLELDSRVGDGSEGRGLPVGLLRLLPHHHVEGGGVLVAEDEAGVVVVRHRVDVERSLEVDPAERRVACRGGERRRTGEADRNNNTHKNR